MLAGSFICTCPPHLTGTRCVLRKNFVHTIVQSHVIAHHIGQA